MIPGKAALKVASLDKTRAYADLQLGQPPKWTPHDGTIQLKEDKGIFFRDPNAAYFPPYPMEPAVRSVIETNPAFRCSDVNVFGCGVMLGNLLRFARKVDCDKAFRFRVDVIGETVFFYSKRKYSERGNSKH